MIKALKEVLPATKFYKTTATVWAPYGQLKKKKKELEGKDDSFL